MKNRTLKRPMFRKGGPAMEGIMTGIQDRTNYNEGGRATELAEEYAKLLRRMAPSPTDRSLPQFLIQGGLNLVSGKGATGNTLRDIASAYQQPTAGLFKGIQARDAYDAQVGMAAAKAGISGAQSEREAALKGNKEKIFAAQLAETQIANEQKILLDSLPRALKGRAIDAATKNVQFKMNAPDSLKRNYIGIPTYSTIRIKGKDQLVPNLNNVQVNQIFYDVITGQYKKRISKGNGKLDFATLDENYSVISPSGD